MLASLPSFRERYIYIIHREKRKKSQRVYALYDIDKPTDEKKIKINERYSE